MYKILVFGMTPNRGGMESVVINFFRYMNRDKIHLDFICTGEGDIGFYEEFDKLSKNPINYYKVPRRRKHPLLYKKCMEKIFQEGNYDAIWLNALAMVNLKNLKYAKKYGVKKIILHSHNSNGAGGIQNFIHNISKNFIGNYATDFWTCSDEATEWMFPKKLHSKVEWIRNAINVEEFLFNNECRRKLRSELGIKDDEFVIGNVARIDPQKNQEFILEIFAEVVKKKGNSRLVLVGGGDISALKKQATVLGISDKILFLGMRKDVARLYNVFDFFLFPSRFEGLPVSLLEVQANCLPTLVSDVITKQVIVNSNYESLSLNDAPSVWADEVLELSKKGRVDKEIVQENFKETGFEIQSEAKRVEKLFLEGNK